MNHPFLQPLVGPGWSEPHQAYELNVDERSTRFDRAQARQLFAWRICKRCGHQWKWRDEQHDCTK